MLITARKIVKYLVLLIYVKIYDPLRKIIFRINGQSFFTIIIYHRVSNEYHDSVTVSIEQFREQVNYLKNNCNVFDLRNIGDVDFSSRKPLVAISFDDGYEDNYLAAEILKAHNLNATFFLTTRIVGTEKAFHHDLQMLGKTVKSLSWEQVKSMSAMGHAFGSHTADHLNLSSVSEDEALQQIEMGKNDLVNVLGDKASPELFAYPYGRLEDMPFNIKSKLHDLGIEFCFSAYGGMNYRKFDKKNIRRQGIDGNFSLLALEAVIRGWPIRLPDRY